MSMKINSQRLARLCRLISSRRRDYQTLIVRDTSAGRPSQDNEEVLGFNGNVLRVRLVYALAQAFGATHFIETGTSHAATAICAMRLLQIPVLSCEVSLLNYVFCKCITFGMKDLQVYHADSRLFLRQQIRGRADLHKLPRPFFYLDAHEGNDPTSLPLLEELQEIAQLPSFLVLIDDFQVPHDNGFRYGSYGGVNLNLELIRTALLNMGVTECFFPNYSPSSDTGFPSGYVVIWRSQQLDRSRLIAPCYPLDLLSSFPSGNCHSSRTSQT